jgi:Xaa-Pro aminopeptidase
MLTDRMNETATPETLEATAWMQSQCIQAYLTVASALRSVLSEARIARAIRDELQASGVRDFWYDIPIVVLIGTNRFAQLIAPEYDVKSPSEVAVLQPGMSFYIDIHPRHESGCWGNFAATGVYHPPDSESAALLKMMQGIQEAGIRHLNGEQTGGDVARWFVRQFEDAEIEVFDVRANFGHSMGSGAKSDYQRLFLDEHNNTPIGGGIYGIEPSGVRRDGSGQISAMARFEDCVYIPPHGGQAVIMGRTDPVPVAF